MDSATRLTKLNEIKDLIFAFEDSEQCFTDSHYFTGSCFQKNDIQGIIFKMKDQEKFENLLGYLDVPAMMNGLLIASASLSGSYCGFIYDDEKFHDSNLKKLNIYVTNELRRDVYAKVK